MTEQLLGRGLCPLPTLSPTDLPLVPIGTPGRQIRKESIFAPGWQANLRKNAPRTGKAGTADLSSGGGFPLITPTLTWQTPFDLKGLNSYK